MAIAIFRYFLFSHLYSLPRLGGNKNKEAHGRRSCHIAACLSYGGQHQRLLVSGGVGDGVRYDELWLMHPQSGRMKEVRTALEDFKS